MNVWFGLGVLNTGKGMRTGWCIVLLSMLAAGIFAGPANAENTPQTTLTVSTDNAGGRTRATLSAHVVQSNEGAAVSGVVTFRSGSLDLGSAFVDAEGNASLRTDVLPAGEHSVVAEYHALTSAQSSVSQPQKVEAFVSTVAGFTVSASPSSLSTYLGGFVSSTITVTPNNGFSGYVSLSCEGLPINTTCTFTPVSVDAACSSTACPGVASVMQIQTEAPSPGSTASNASDSGYLRYAFVLPALFGLAGLGAGKRRAWRNLALVLAAFAGLMSLTACSQRYRYLNHGPPGNPGSSLGNYTVTIESQSSNGSSTITPPTNPQIALTITKD